MLGPTALFAAFTGVLSRRSSLTSSWADDWFALHRLHDVLADQRLLDSCSDPTLPAFVGLPIEVRHVTLSTSFVAAGIASMGVLNLAMRFTLAFSMVLRSHGLTPRMRCLLRRDVLRRLAGDPWKALVPPRK